MFKMCLVVAILSFGAGAITNESKIIKLEKRLSALEQKTEPITKTFDNLCSGKEDDFYEGFYRLLMEKCDKTK